MYSIFTLKQKSVPLHLQERVLMGSCFFFFLKSYHIGNIKNQVYTAMKLA